MFISRLALVAALGLAASQAQAADFFGNCGGAGCTLQPGDYYQDYALPTDGHSYLWSFKLTSSDPDATIYLGGPNQRDAYQTTSLGGGQFFTEVIAPYPYTFIRHAAPGLVSFEVRGPISFDSCSVATPASRLCAQRFYIWGNGTPLTVIAKAPVTMFFSISPIPEPATWALMVLGLGAVGATLRARRRQTLTGTSRV